MTAGIETLHLLKSRKVYKDLEEKTSALAEGMSRIAGERSIPLCVNQTVGMLTVFFTQGPVVNYQTAKTSDTKRFAQFFINMMEEGIYLPPSQFEAWFVSLAHTPRDIEMTLEAFDTALRKL